MDDVTRDLASPKRPLTIARVRKAIKYGLVQLAGGPLEQVLFLGRLTSARVRAAFGRPYTALYDMDRKLQKHLGFRNGTFIEAGANDGIAQSNTFFLERKLGWRGLLVEPIPKYHAMCRRSRRATVANCALGTFENEGGTLEILAGGLMSVPTSVDKSQLHGRSANEHASFGAKEFGLRVPQLIQVKVRALSNLLDELGISKVDFFSLDVEGFELEVLKGLDLERHAPRFILIETQQVEALLNMLQPRYILLEKLSHHDFLFKRVA